MSEVSVANETPVAIEVGRCIQKEFPTIQLATISGRPIRRLGKQENFGFLQESSAPRVTSWQKVFSIHRRGFLGVLYLSDTRRGATTQEWVLEVYGVENMEPLAAIARQLCTKFVACVHIQLVAENQQSERLPFDVRFRR